MIVFSNRWGIRYREVWFDELVTGGQDIVVGCQRIGCPQGAKLTPFHTLVIDLGLPPEDIFKAFNEGTRYEVRRAEKSDGLAFEFDIEPQMHLNAFCIFYDAFAKMKGLSPARVEHFWRYADAGHLLLTRIVKDDEPLVWHAYICAAGRARLLHSASLFREQDNARRNLIGRANRYLHWLDILAFKDRGYRLYDFGGWSSPELGDVEKLRINAFKEGFGGRLVSEFNCTYPTSAKGQLMLYAKQMKTMWQQTRAGKR